METVDTRADALRQKALDGAVPQTAATVGVDQIFVFDDVLPDPLAYRAAVLALPFRSIPLGPVTFHGIAACEYTSLPHWMQTEFPETQPGLTFFRRSPVGQVEPNYIHTDRDMGDWTAILYLNPDPPEGDGTAFFQQRQTLALSSTAATATEFYDEWQQWRETTRWRRWRTVAARFNRVVVFAAPMFHARAIADNYGVGDDARLIQVMFGTGALCL